MNLICLLKGHNFSNSNGVKKCLRCGKKGGGFPDFISPPPSPPPPVITQFLVAAVEAAVLQIWAYFQIFPLLVAAVAAVFYLCLLP